MSSSMALAVFPFSSIVSTRVLIFFASILLPKSDDVLTENGMANGIIKVINADAITILYNLVLSLYVHSITIVTNAQIGIIKIKTKKAERDSSIF
ncbi:hypothetical protein R84B8_03078 [Treponema sp. R8-4-B8]